MWSDVRTSQICDRISSTSQLGVDKYRSVTGLPISTYFSATKLVYLLETIPKLREDANKGDALFGTIDQHPRQYLLAQTNSIHQN